MSKTLRLFLVLLAIGALLIGALIVGVFLISGSQVPSFLGQPRVLHLKISPQASESPGQENLLSDPENFPPLTTEITRLIYDAAADENITGIKFELVRLPFGWASTQELRAALKYFSDTGKPCEVWGENFGNKEYYLATACDTIYISPSGVSLVNGLSITQSYYADMLEKLEIEADFVHVGDFKTAVEAYEKTGPSEEATLATNEMLSSLYSQLTNGIKEFTKTDPKALIDNPPITPEQAKQSGMITDIKFRDEVFESNTDEILSTKDYLRHRRRVWTEGEKKIAVLYASGAIVNGKSGASMFGSEFIGDKSISRYLKTIRNDDSIKAVVLRVNSPGGSGSASDNIWREIERIKETGKPVIVSMGDYAASGGYYISMNADRIFAQEGTITGSIGVFGGKMALKGLYKKMGINQVTFQQGEQATLFSTIEPFSDAEKEKFKEYLGSFYDRFITLAAQGRQLPTTTMEESAKGRVWTGEMALERQLIDEIGGLDNAIDYAAESVGAAQYAIEVFPPRKTFMDLLIEQLSGSTTDVSIKLPGFLHEALHPAITLEAVLRNTNAAVMLPMAIEIK